MRPGCLILTATILRSSIKASCRQNIVHRERSRKELGPKFDIRTFHDEMLNGGSLPLDLLEARTDKWIAERRPRRWRVARAGMAREKKQINKRVSDRHRIRTI